jgi:phosphopantothenoylcysteine decarboxylase/phosphopantothenate--cysteine ligase
MGQALAAAAAARGARVTLVTTVPHPPLDATLVPVDTAQEMLVALQQVAPHADALLMAAAVADFTPARPASHKIKRGTQPLRLELVPAVDVLAGVRPMLRAGSVVVAFAAETQDLVASAEKKLKVKGVDAIVANDLSVPGIGMGSDDNAVTLIVPGRPPEAISRRPKWAVAERVLDLVLELRHIRQPA